MNNFVGATAFEKVLLNDVNLIREIKKYVDIKPLLNTSSLQLTNKKKCFDWKLTSDATKTYYKDKKFQLKLLSLVSDPIRQIQLNKNVKYII